MNATPPPSNGSFEHHFRDRFESLLPTIQKRWPELAQHTLEATRGGVDELVRLIEQNTGLTPQGVREQLEELMHAAGDQSRHLGDSLDPLEEQLEQLLDELNRTLRPRIEEARATTAPAGGGCRARFGRVARGDAQRWAPLLMADQQKPRGLGAAARMTALAAR